MIRPVTRLPIRTLILLILIVGAVAVACDDEGDATTDAPEPATTAVQEPTDEGPEDSEPEPDPTPAPESDPPVEGGPGPEASYAPDGAALGSAMDNTAEIQALAEGLVVDRPEELAAEIAAMIDAGAQEGPTATVAETIPGEPATAYIVVTGLPDDSVSGGVITVTMDPDDTTGWGVTTSTTTPICGRGVGQQGLCL